MYAKIFRHVLNPFFETVIKKRKMLEYRGFLEKSQWWTREELLEFQWKELKKLLKHAYTQVPYWQDVFQKLKMTDEDIKTYDDFRRLPIVTKDDIRQNKERMIARNYVGKTWTKSTGGSTGVPLELDYTPESFDWRVAASRRGYGWAGCEDGMKQAWIWGVDIGEKSSLRKIKESLHYRLLGKKVFNCFQFDEKRMMECLDELNNYKPEIIVGYTNPLYNFAKFCHRQGGVRFRPVSIISAAEKLHEYQRREIFDVFQAPVFNTYGSREFMLIAAECEYHDGLHVSMENLYVEIIKEDGQPAAGGETGDLVISDLHNYGMPFLRYSIGDMASASDRKCACKRGLPMVQAIVGRSLDMIKTPDGKNIPGEFFPHLMKEFKGVRQFQVVQKALDRLEIKIIKTNQFRDSDFDFMKNEIYKVAGRKINIEFLFVNEIPLTKTGKYRVTVSEIKD